MCQKKRKKSYGESASQCNITRRQARLFCRCHAVMYWDLAESVPMSTRAPAEIRGWREEERRVRYSLLAGFVPDNGVEPTSFARQDSEQTNDRPATVLHPSNKINLAPSTEEKNRMGDKGRLCVPCYKKEMNDRPVDGVLSMAQFQDPSRIMPSASTDASSPTKARIAQRPSNAMRASRTSRRSDP